MITILSYGRLSGQEDIVLMAQRHQRVIMPTEDEVELTHWWVLIEDGQEFLYIGNEETFAQYTKEHNRG